MRVCTVCSDSGQRSPRSQKVNLPHLLLLAAACKICVARVYCHIVLGNVLREERHVGSSLLQGAQEIGYGTILSQGCSSLMVVTGFVATTLVLARLIAPSRRGQGQTGHLRDREMSVTDP